MILEIPSQGTRLLVKNLSIEQFLEFILSAVQFQPNEPALDTSLNQSVNWNV